MTEDALGALADEVGRATALLEGLGPEDWERPTRCPPMTVRVMAAHVLRQARQILEYPREPGEPETDAVSYYRYDPAAVSAGVLARAQEVAASLDPATLLAEWRRRWPDALEAARSAWSDDPVIRTPLGGIRLREYVRTRCVEAAVHHMDLRDALGLDPAPSPAALAITVGVLEGLLGAPLAATGMDAVRFALAGTGRLSLGHRERATLGPLAEKFPLLA